MAAISSPGNKDAGTGILQSTLSPKYLHTNSTSHTWPFSAIAELIDNAYDPDVKASQLWIDKLQLRGKTCLSFTDNGFGMTPEKLHKMLSFGFCEKVAEKGHMPVGHYGNGFKSGSMRLGKDALVLTKKENSRSVGFLSQTYLQIIRAETVLVPIVTWDKKEDDFVVRPDGAKALEDILKYSLLHNEKELTNEYDKIIGPHGTRIIISNIRKNMDNKPEFDFITDEYDIRIPDDANTEGGRYRQTKRQNHIPECDYSLKAYCAILYLKPRMQIILRGKKVRTLNVEKSLSQTEVDRYKPQALHADAVKVVFGFNSLNKNHYGIMMYHRNRLIKPYERVGHQLKANNLGVGVVGVVQCDFLQPTHNKQDFDYTKAYRSCIYALGIKLNEYWNEKKGPAKATNNSQPIPEPQELQSMPDQNWVQCDEPTCLKWRKLPDGIDPSSLPDKWYCHMNPDVNYKSCDVPEEKDDVAAPITPYAKVQKKRLERELQEKNRREKEVKAALQLAQDQKAQQLKEREEAIKKKEEHLNKQFAVLQDSKPKIKTEGANKLPTAQVLPTQTMVKVSKPLHAVSPTANQARSVQTRPSTHTPIRVNLSTTAHSPVKPSQSTSTATAVSQSNPHLTVPNQTTPRAIAAKLTTPSGLAVNKSTPRQIMSSVLTPVTMKSSSGIQLTPVKPKPVELTPQAIKIVAKAPPGNLETGRVSFKVMKSPDGNTFLVQEKVASTVTSSTAGVRSISSTPSTTQKVVAVSLPQSPGGSANVNKPVPAVTALTEVSRNNVDVKPPLSVVLPKPQAPAATPTMVRTTTTANDRSRLTVPATQQTNTSVHATAQSVKIISANAVTSVSSAGSFPRIVNAISTAIRSSAENNKKLIPAGVKREHGSDVVSPISAKTQKKVDAIIVIDPLPANDSKPKPQDLQKNATDNRIKELEIEFKEKISKLQLQLDEKTNQLNRTSNELDEKKKILVEKVNELDDKTKILKNLRANVCKLLQVLVPEIDVDCEEGKGEGETVDELLKQVLDANK